MGGRGAGEEEEEQEEEQEEDEEDEEDKEDEGTAVKHGDVKAFMNWANFAHSAEAVHDCVCCSILAIHFISLDKPTSCKETFVSLMRRKICLKPAMLLMPRPETLRLVSKEPRHPPRLEASRN